MESELSYPALDDFLTYLTHKGAVTQFFEQLVSQFCSHCKATRLVVVTLGNVSCNLSRFR